MDSLWTETADHLRELASKPEKFLEPKKCQPHLEKAKVLTKVYYDASKLLETEKDPDTLPELIIQDFDVEQVWAGVDLQNKSKFGTLADEVHDLLSLSHEQFNLLAKPKKVAEVDEDDEDDLKGLNIDKSDFFDDEELENGEGDEEEDASDVEEEEDEDELEEEEEDENEEKDDMDDILNDPDFQHMSDSDLDDKLPLFEGSDEDEDEDDSETERKEEVKEQAVEKRKQDVNKKADDYMANALKSMRSMSGKEPISNPRSEVEDQFFNLDEMEKFLDHEDAADNRRRMREEKGLESDEEDLEGIDIFSADLGGQGPDDEAVTGAKYSSYFGIKRSEVAEADNEESDEDEEEDDEEEDDDEAENGPKADLLEDDEGDEEDDADVGEMKSSHEERMARLRKKIKRMEEEAVQSTTSDGKMWQMKGEVAAIERPENSLLQDHLDYDTVAKQAPVITEAVSKTLEDIIIQRIKDKAWDDVERKVKPVENPYEYKKRLVLDQEKSKLSLAQVYEQEYLKQQESLEEAKKKPGMLDDDGNETIPAEVESIKKSMKLLFAKLDTLTHFHYTPKLQDAEVKIIRNAPTLAMEEVAPVVMSDANLLAPQEIIDKSRGEDIGQTERDETDKKRDRRKKKSNQRQKAKEKEKREKLVNKLNPGLGNKYSKAKMMKDLETAEKQGKLTQIKEDVVKGKSVKSSTAFFNQLQNEAQSVVKQGKSSTANKKKDSKLIASNLKL